MPRPCVATARMGALGMSDSIPLIQNGNSCHLDVALMHAQAGIYVFPCNGDRSPRTTNGFKDAATDEFTVRRWWKSNPDALVGIACGLSGLIVFDCDEKKGHTGVKAFMAVANQHGIDLSQCPSTVTPSNGGRHAYFALPPGFEHGNKDGDLPDGIDVRCAGYVIAAGCELPDGGRYEHLNGTPDLPTAYRAGAVPVLPSALQARLTAPKAKNGPPGGARAAAVCPPDPAAPMPARGVPTERERSYAAAALSRTHADLASRAPGTGRNQALNDAALAMGEMVAAGWIERAEVERALLDACQRNGYLAKDGEQAALATLRSGLAAGMRRPRAPLADGDLPILPGVAAFVAALPIPHPHGQQQLAPAVPVASPFVWRDPATIPPRAWLYGRHYIGQFVSATVAPGGVGKSSLVLAEALAMASGRNLIGHQPSGALNVWVINGEDPMDELQRRFAAAMLKHNVSPADITGRLHVNSGRDTEFIIAEATKDGTKICQPVYGALVSEIKSKNIDVLIVDPFVSFHSVSENDNNAINDVAKAFVRIADETGCAIELVHHSRKTNGYETTVNDARGASSLGNAARSARALNRMTDAEATKAGVDADDAATYFRITKGGKENLAKASAKDSWCRIEELVLSNGDAVGVVTGWRWPAPGSEFDADMIAQAQAIVAGGSYRMDQRSPDWVGHAIGGCFSYDKTTSNAAHKKAVGAIIAALVAEGWLRMVELPAPTRGGHTAKFVQVGKQVITINLPGFVGSSVVSDALLPD